MANLESCTQCDARARAKKLESASPIYLRVMSPSSALHQSTSADGVRSTYGRKRKGGREAVAAATGGKDGELAVHAGSRWRPVDRTMTTVTGETVAEASRSDRPSQRSPRESVIASPPPPPLSPPPEGCRTVREAGRSASTRGRSCPRRQRARHDDGAVAADDIDSEMCDGRSS